MKSVFDMTEAELNHEIFLRVFPHLRDIDKEMDVRVKAAMGDLDDLPELSRVAARLEPAARRAFIEAVAQVRDQVSLNQLAEAVRLGDLTRIEAEAKLAEFGVAVEESLKAPLNEGFLRGAEFANETLVSEINAGIRFDLINPHAVSFAERNLPNLVGPMVEGSRENIARIVSQSVSGEFTTAGAARRIRDHVGLAPRDVRFIEKFEQNLREQGVSERDITRRVDKMNQALIRRRSLVIARTEIIRAANAGQQALWMEGLNQGLIERDTSVRKWVVTHDDRLDAQICEPLDGVEASLTGSFEHPFNGKTYDFPPAHPSCRCAIVRVVRRLRSQ